MMVSVSIMLAMEPSTMQLSMPIYGSMMPIAMAMAPPTIQQKPVAKNRHKDMPTIILTAMISIPRSRPMPPSAVTISTTTAMAKSTSASKVYFFKMTTAMDMEI